MYETVSSGASIASSVAGAARTASASPTESGSPEAPQMAFAAAQSNVGASAMKTSSSAEAGETVTRQRRVSPATMRSTPASVPPVTPMALSCGVAALERRVAEPVGERLVEAQLEGDVARPVMGRRRIDELRRQRARGLGLGGLPGGGNGVGQKSAEG